MHAEQCDFIKSTKDLFAPFFSWNRVLEIGSLNVNGSVRQFFDNCSYVGVDVIEGRDVDIVSFAHDLGFADGTFDVVILSESLEHDLYWQKTLGKAVSLLRPGGLMIVTCAGPSRSEHGTRRVCPFESGTSRIADIAVADHYQGLSQEDLSSFLPETMFSVHAFSVGAGGLDTYFYGVKVDA